MAEKALILNYYGNQSFKVRDNENDKSWNELGQDKLAESKMQWWVKDEENLVPKNYLWEYDDDEVSYQTCTAVAKLYSTKNGEPEDEDNENLNKKYFLALKSTPAPL